MIGKSGKIDGSNPWRNHSWRKPPQHHEIVQGRLYVRTFPNTDLWQETHYKKRRDNGHCLLTKVNYDFSLTVRTKFFPKHQYDQCGLIVRVDSRNWIKASTEYENSSLSRLGSVVTNNGYSDWATIDINSKVNKMWYKIQRKGNDFYIYRSNKGKLWKQIRISHLLCEFTGLKVGVYACSPNEKIGFDSIFDNYHLEKING
ncbi:MAG: DUF1349 domain-containing protein [Candidatus Saganbacteria bacterium]|nr:DUF1349 domain-containing protein [Candidatus Saganbacteria bacterium]